LIVEGPKINILIVEGPYISSCGNVMRKPPSKTAEGQKKITGFDTEGPQISGFADEGRKLDFGDR
jgi:hypothetical protein